MRIALALLLVAGCTADVDPLLVEDVFELGTNPAVDVLFVIDDSNTMAPIQASLAAAWPSVAAPLAGAEWQVGITTTDFDDPTARGRLRPLLGDDRVLDPLDGAPAVAFSTGIAAGVEGSPIERGLQTAWAAVTPPVATHENDGFVRDDARLAIVIVSDEDDCSDEGALGQAAASDCQTRPDLLVPSAEFATRFAGLKDGLGDATVHAVVDTSDPETGCGLGNPGTRYVDVARRTGGRVLPPCGDFGSTMATLGAEIAGLRRTYPLSRTADVLSLAVSLETLTAGAAALPEDATGISGWTYDTDANAVTLGDDVALTSDTVVRISYTVPTF